MMLQAILCIKPLLNEQKMVIWGILLLYYDIPGNEVVTRIRQLNCTQLNATFKSNVEKFKFE
mgnify:FL=1